MKTLIYFIGMFVSILFTSYEKSELDNVEPVKVDSIVNSIDTNSVIMDSWQYVYSYRNETLISLDSLQSEYNQHPDPAKFYKSLSLFANDYGLYSFDFTDNQRKNMMNNTYDYYDSICIGGGNINCYSTTNGDQTFKIESLTD